MLYILSLNNKLAFPGFTTFSAASKSASKLGSELQESSSGNTRRSKFSGHSDLLQSSARDPSAGWCNDTPDLQQGRTLPRCKRSQRDSEHDATRMGSRNQVQSGRAKQAC